MTKYERLMLQIVIFLVPTNLAYHWYGEWAYINGRLVDYLLPKLYLSDIAIVCLFGFYLYRSITSGSSIRSFINAFSGGAKFTVILTLITVGYLLIQAMSALRPLPSLWMTIKMAEMAWLIWYIVRHYRRRSLLNALLPPLWLSAILQSIIGLSQFITQKSVFGYYLFGEVNLDRLGIAYESYLGRLLVPPYGTTPHPNVLAGFLTFTLLCMLARRNVPIVKGSFILSCLSIGLFSLVLALTVSFECFLALLAGVGFLLLSSCFISRRVCLLFSAFLLSGLILSPLLVGVLYHSPVSFDNASITTRYELNLAAFELIKRAPLTGVGLNGFIPAMVSTGSFSGQRTLVYQPVHHIFLLLAAEIGLIGLVLVGTIIYSLHTRPQKPQPLDASTTLPLLCILIIGLFDHFPGTLQTGQLLLSFGLSLLWVSEST